MGFVSDEKKRRAPPTILHPTMQLSKLALLVWGASVDRRDFQPV